MNTQGYRELLDTPTYGLSAASVLVNGQGDLYVCMKVILSVCICITARTVGGRDSLADRVDISVLSTRRPTTGVD